MERVDLLIADDEPYVTRSLSYVFQREGISFDVASDGEEALTKVQTLHPRILFLDIMMPKLSGHDLCARLKGDTQSQSPYIIMLTAKGQEEDKTKSLSMGADEYITKPFSPQFLVKHVKELLERL